MFALRAQAVRSEQRIEPALFAILHHATTTAAL
ncbi:hypothetical protein BFJ69_g8076 [Fusarium oxysporum]|uniref:Uncharacterized protein n=1 Tax=Fusarium oxysporum TaxID=5507 RepID=A0A420N3S8_FUSOX|nr:hypothetical protein BFJ69_g8076 [Fusarium oxysporum]